MKEFAASRASSSTAVRGQRATNALRPFASMRSFRPRRFWRSQRTTSSCGPQGAPCYCSRRPGG